MKRKTLKISLLLGLLLALYIPAKASVLWDGDAATHTPTEAFSSLNIENNPGVIDVVTDGTYGKVFRMICYDPTTNIKTRTEGSHMKNFQPVAGGTYYFGWRHKWGPLPTACGKWQVLNKSISPARVQPVARCPSVYTWMVAMPTCTSNIRTAAAHRMIF